MKILVTSSSSKTSLINLIIRAALRVDDKALVLASDVNEKVVSGYFFKNFKTMPEISRDNFLKILNFLKKNQIDLIFPTRDGELKFWAQYKDELFKNDISVVVSNLKSIQVCLNKLDFYNFGLKNRFNFIETYESIKDLPKSDKYVVKKKAKAF